MSAHKHPEPVSSLSASAPGIPNSHFPLRAVTVFMFAVALAVAMAALLLPRDSHAQQPAPLDSNATAEVRRIQDYLNGLSTIEARFVQVTSKGAMARGRLWLQRPGRLRFDYDPPVPILIVSDGETLLFKDEELEHYSYTSFDDTPAAFFVGANIDFFTGNLTITNFERDQNSLYLSLVNKKDPRGGAMTLVMNAKPVQLRKWMVVDAQGVSTTVSLLAPAFGRPVDPGLFEVEQRWRTERDAKRERD